VALVAQMGSIIFQKMVETLWPPFASPFTGRFVEFVETELMQNGSQKAIEFLDTKKSFKLGYRNNTFAPVSSVILPIECIYDLACMFRDAKQMTDIDKPIVFRLPDYKANNKPKATFSKEQKQKFLFDALHKFSVVKVRVTQITKKFLSDENIMVDGKVIKDKNELIHRWDSGCLEYRQEKSLQSPSKASPFMMMNTSSPVRATTPVAKKLRLAAEEDLKSKTAIVGIVPPANTIVAGDATRDSSFLADVELSPPEEKPSSVIITAAATSARVGTFDVTTTDDVETCAVSLVLPQSDQIDPLPSIVKSDRMDQEVKQADRKNFKAVVSFPDEMTGPTTGGGESSPPTTLMSMSPEEKDRLIINTTNDLAKAVKEQDFRKISLLVESLQKCIGQK
jgi:hypothetical protein